MGIKLYKKEKRVIEDVSNDAAIEVTKKLMTSLLSAAFDKTLTRENIEKCDDTFIEELLATSVGISETNDIPLGDVVAVIDNNMIAIVGSLYRIDGEITGNNEQPLVDYRVKVFMRNALKFKQACLKNFGTGDESCKNLIRKFGKEIEKFEQQIKELHGKNNN